MISFDQFVLEDSGPVYLQIMRYIRQGIAAGVIGDREEVPSRRALSTLLGVNPNTVQKAYRLLEEAGLIASHAGAKSYVSASLERIEAVRAELLVSDVRRLAAALRQTGVSREEAQALLGRLWDEDEKKEADCP